MFVPQVSFCSVVNRTGETHAVAIGSISNRRISHERVQALRRARCLASFDKAAERASLDFGMGRRASGVLEWLVRLDRGPRSAPSGVAAQSGLAGEWHSASRPWHEARPAQCCTVLQHASRGQAAGAGVSGKAVTPFLLARILETTVGRSLTANVALVRNNAALAAQIALVLGRMVAQGRVL
jgi:hypothetical protein